MDAVRPRQAHIGEKNANTNQYHNDYVILHQIYNPYSITLNMPVMFGE